MMPQLEVNEQRLNNTDFFTSVVLYSKLAKSRSIRKVDGTKTNINNRTDLRLQVAHNELRRIARNQKQV
jgi:hypothetical protein